MSTAASTGGEEYGLVGETPKWTYTNHMQDWVALAHPKVLPHTSKTLYSILRAFIIEDKREDPDVVRVTQEDLAEMMHCSVDTVQRALKPLYTLGLVEDKERRKVSTREPGQKPKVITVLIMRINKSDPPAGYTGFASPFQALKTIRANRKPAGRSDTASLREVDDDGAAGSNEQSAKPQATGTASDKTAGQCDTATVSETDADLPENGAQMRSKRSKSSRTNALPPSEVVRASHARTREAPAADLPPRRSRPAAAHVSAEELNRTAHGVRARRVVARWRQGHETPHRYAVYRDISKEVDQLLKDGADPDLLLVALGDWDYRGKTIGFLKNCYDDAVHDSRPVHERRRTVEPRTATSSVVDVEVEAAVDGLVAKYADIGFLALPEGAR